MDKKTADQLFLIIAEALDLDIKEIIPESSFEDLGADSLDQVEIIMAIEEKFGIDIPDSDSEKIVTIEDALVYLSTHLP